MATTNIAELFEECIAVKFITQRPKPQKPTHKQKKHTLSLDQNQRTLTGSGDGARPIGHAIMNTTGKLIVVERQTFCYQALGKQSFCRVSADRHSAKKGHMEETNFTERRQSAKR